MEGEACDVIPIELMDGEPTAIGAGLQTFLYRVADPQPFSRPYRACRSNERHWRDWTGIGDDDHRSWRSPIGYPGDRLVAASGLALVVKRVWLERLQDAGVEGMVGAGWPKRHAFAGDTIFGPLTRGQLVVGMSDAFPFAGDADSVVDWFAEHWDATHPAGSKWSDNPFVFGIEFRRA